MCFLVVPISALLSKKPHDRAARLVLNFFYQFFETIGLNL